MPILNEEKYRWNLRRPSHIPEHWVLLTMRIAYGRQTEFFDYLRMDVGHFNHYYAQGYADGTDDNGSVPWVYFVPSVWFADPDTAFEAKMRFG